MTGRCAKCGTKAREGYRSPLGDLVCERHSVQINGAVIGGLAAGLPGAVIGPRLLSWIRGSLGPRKKADTSVSVPTEERDPSA